MILARVYRSTLCPQSLSRSSLLRNPYPHPQRVIPVPFPFPLITSRYKRQREPICRSLPICLRLIPYLLSYLGPPVLTTMSSSSKTPTTVENNAVNNFNGGTPSTKDLVPAIVFSVAVSSVPTGKREFAKRGLILIFESVALSHPPVIAMANFRPQTPFPNSHQQCHVLPHPGCHPSYSEVTCRGKVMTRELSVRPRYCDPFSTTPSKANTPCR